jgi:hypothetical protein
MKRLAFGIALLLLAGLAAARAFVIHENGEPFIMKAYGVYPGDEPLQLRCVARSDSKPGELALNCELYLVIEN